ncbi:Uncharacterised protein [Vibrio cholerae]|nr:Uncharacterised protein [Vibrio cholerae]CSI25654.1 Uncharacterised protein [Vibrio cholerae]CSI38986.1 Uncharacterised protein [Vibrio cholerae]
MTDISSTVALYCHAPSTFCANTCVRPSWCEITLLSTKKSSSGICSKLSKLARMKRSMALC